MAESDKNEIYLSSSPHFHSPLTTSKIMWMVVIALLPICAAGVIIFGLRALDVLILSVSSCVLFEFLFNTIVYGKKEPEKKWTIKDGSAVITGLLLACTLSPLVPFWQVILGAFFSMVVIKGFFGGLGQNIWNPALGGRAFLFICFPTTMGAQWLDPATDAVSGATILSQASQFTSYWDLFLGRQGGCIGETAAICILISGLFLISIKIIDWRIPLSFIGTVALFTLISGGDVLAAILSGGLFLGAFFMATDYVTSPVTPWGRVIFGAGCGLITFLIRRFGGYPEGVMFSILFMNCIYPFLNNITPRIYGYGKKKKEAK
ncbi:MAG: RnfABCDGE type electron transport complex subunit D [Treponema sp.]|nr:RnfABCDGE type electron transport complex subunit D [Treponema sp.]